MTFPPVVVEPIIQKSAADCAIASLAMLLGRPYAEVSAECLRMTRKPHSLGLGTRQINALAKRLGAALVKGSVKDLDTATGLLYVDMADVAHACLLFEGVVVNPSDGMIYSLDTYLSAHRATINSFWALEEPPNE